MSDLVGNTEHRFSHIAVHVMCTHMNDVSKYQQFLFVKTTKQNHFSVYYYTVLNFSNPGLDLDIAD